ncbi:MAG: usg protein [Beijerinckiaceae bacterium]|nr:usg protein [Beijerinckiaceae bacterium]
MTAPKRIETHRVSPDFLKQLAGYGLATARILYHLPDHPRLLQTYIWQDYDLAPEFPVLLKFLVFWQKKLDGPLHSVVVGHSKLIRPAEIRAIGGEFRLH